MAAKSPTYGKVLSNLRGYCARGAVVVAVATEGDGEIAQHADHVIYVPRVRGEFSAVTANEVKL